MSNKEYMTRTIITAGKRWFQGDEEMIEIQVASWEPRSYVHRSISVIDDDMIRHYIEEGDMCFVYVNTGADRASELRFERWEKAPSKEEVDAFWKEVEEQWAEKGYYAKNQ